VIVDGRRNSDLKTRHFFVFIVLFTVDRCYFPVALGALPQCRLVKEK